MSTYDQLKQAEALAVRCLGASGFEDLFLFQVISYTDEELEDLDERDWVGQYVRGSVDSDRGLTVLVAIDKHEGIVDLADTILHEVGHACWELLDDDSRARWSESEGGYKYGSEEAFADDFMRWCIGEKYKMENCELFEEISQT